ncbi:hypothetical protein [Nocardia sp. NPDC051570]|uniref:hypothetical protein n=1 Tax=Nocardia sp. NPDC051570 TaxID=3364324 RepID=UPI00378FEF17
MESNLIAGYLAYATADEYGAGASGEVMASTPSVSVTITVATSGASVSASVAATAHFGC